MTFIFYLWIFSTLYLVLHYLVFHSSLALHKPESRRPFRGGVSVIICAKNEAENLGKYLPLILEQDFPKYEVIVVNDGSTDGSADVLTGLRKKYRRLKIVTISAEESSKTPGKKGAILAGIEKARNRYLLFTDADCEAASNNWLKSMVAHFRTKEIVLGFSPYRDKGGFISKITQWETLLTAQQYLGFALVGLPYMGVGRNLAYSKGLFFNSTRFRKHMDLASGDDDLFISERANHLNTAIEISSDAFTFSDPPKNLTAWWRQKRRHLSTGTYYKFIPALLLGLFGLAQLNFYILLVPVIILGQTDTMFWIAISAKFMVQLLVMIPSARKLNQQKILWLFPIWELITVIFLTIIQIQSRFKSPRQSWK